MAKSYFVSKRQNVENVKHKSYSKLRVNKNMTISKKEKPCNVSLRRTDMETHSRDVKQSSFVSEQTARISLTPDNKLYSSSLKGSCKNLDKFQKTSEVQKTFFDSKSSVKLNCNTSSSSSFITFHDHNVIKPCYIKLERLNISVKHPHLHFAEERNEFKNIEFYDSSNCADYKNRSSISKSLTHVALLSQPSDTGSNSESDKSQQSSIVNMLKPCTVRLSRCFDNESLSHMKHAVFSLDNCEMNQHIDFEGSMNESFISASLLSTPSSMVRSETSKTKESQDVTFPHSSPKSDANRKIELADDNLSKSTSLKCKRLLSFSNTASKLVENEEMRTLGSDQNAVMRSESLLSFDACNSMDLDADKEIKVLDENFLKHSKKRKAKLSSSSSDCNTVRNSKNCSVDSREMLFKLSNKKKAKVSYASSSTFDSSNDSSLEVIDSIAMVSSAEQSVKKNHNTLLGTSSNGRTENINATEKTKLVKLFSSSSSDCSSVRNSKNCSVNSREMLFEQSHKKKAKVLSYTSSSTFDSSNDSSSEVNDSTAMVSSAGQSLKKKHNILLGTSSHICNGTTEKINAIEKTNLVLCEQGQNSSDRINTKKEKNLGRECKLSCNSETENNFSDNSFSSSRINANSRILKNKYSKRNKHSKRKHFVVNGTFSSSKVKLVFPDKKSISDLPDNKSGNAERKCNASPVYNIKPCSVILTREENIAKKLGEKSNNINKVEPLKPVSQVDCIELNCNKQIKSSKENDKCKINKSKRRSQSHISVREKRNSVFVEECIKHRDLESEKDCTKKCTNFTTNRNFIDLLEDSTVTSNQQSSSSKQCRKPVYSSSDSDPLPTINEIVSNSRHPRKKNVRTSRKESDDSAIENCNQLLNDNERQIINENVEEIHVVKDTDCASHRSCSPVNSVRNRLAERVYSPDLDDDDAYLADTDDYSDSDLCAESHTANPIPQKNEKISTGSKVNPSESENQDKSIPKKIPYRCVEQDNSVEKNFNIFPFKSKTSGKVYLVDLFEYENIKKMFVTIHMKRHLNFNTLHGNNLPTVSQRIKALGCFDKEDKKIQRRSPFIFTYIDDNVSGNEDNCVEIHHQENSLSNSKNNLNGKHIVVLSSSEDNSKSSHDICRESGPSCSNTSQYNELTLSTTCSDSSNNSDDCRTDCYCVHCHVKFSSKKENYNHTCRGKLQKGFLCIYCEKIYLSYSKLLSHKQLHFI